ncbi:MAG: hypothetical protein K2Y26_17860 [Gemmatimonadaceae bacterium]|nr:hypothetical protein [Gemmatimonadaceae bacterium]
MPSSPDSPILLLDEAAALLRVEPDWLQRSTCPRARIGGVVRYDRETCLAWMRAHITPKMDTAA